MADTYKILIADDNEANCELMEAYLAGIDCETEIAVDGQDTLDKVASFQPDLILLDIMMPRMDGIETCRRLRGMPGMDGVFIIFLTARAEEYSELAGFEAGGDDYIPKPIKPRVLLSRIKAILRRKGSEGENTPPAILQVRDLEIDKDEYVVRRKGETIVLPRKEFDLLFFLASRPGKVYRREKLLERVWGDVMVVDRTVDVHVRKLREKLGDDYIVTVKGVGYKFMTE